jgi:small neutral amino acid transporter SnatA (MarC family)
VYASVGLLLGLIAASVVQVPARRLLSTRRPYAEWPPEDRRRVMPALPSAVGMVTIWFLALLGGAHVDSGRYFFAAALFLLAALTWVLVSRWILENARRVMSRG